MANYRKLAAVLFADIAGYTYLMQKDEANASMLLKRFQNDFNNKVTDYNGRVVSFFGDGALCSFQCPLEAIQFAIEVQSGFQSEPKVPVRIGIHSGTVVYEDDGAFGDCINVASRIESMGIPGAILLSKKVRDELKNQQGLSMISLGRFDLKNVEEPIEIYALGNEGFAIPKSDEMHGKVSITNKPLEGIEKNMLLVMALGLILLICLQWSKTISDEQNYQRSVRISSIIAGFPTNSIAVLPFENITNDEESQQFIDGIHDDLLTHLSKMKDIHVVSRTSVKKYKDTDKSALSIGLELQVPNVIEGSIRREGDLVRINVQLINTACDDHLWAEIYDEQLVLDRNFEIQTDLVLRISDALREVIGPLDNGFHSWRHGPIQ